MEILLILVISILAVALAIAVGAAMSWSATNRLLRRWTVEGSHRERRLRRKVAIQQAKIDLLYNSLLQNNGIKTASAKTTEHIPNSTTPTGRRIVAPSEAVSRQKEMDAKSLAAVGSTKTSTRNGAAGGR